MYFPSILVNGCTWSSSAKKEFKQCCKQIKTKHLSLIKKCKPNACHITPS
jgi:hypothetical protein